MDTINIFSLNTKGLNIPEKRRMLLHDLKRAHTDIAFLQETHFKTGNPPCLKKWYFPHYYHATNVAARSKGVSILLSTVVPWTCSDTLVDPEGCYVFIKEWIGDKKVTLATIYAPNDRQDAFLPRILNLLAEFREGHLILGGDINIPLAPTVDTSSCTSSIRTSTNA